MLNKSLSLALLFACGISYNTAQAAPSITITKPLCAYGAESCYISGKVSGVSKYSNYIVAPYIKVDEVWWTKPTYASPVCQVSSTGNYSCYVTTGGSDPNFTSVSAFLMPKNSDPDLCSPCFSIPENIASLAKVTLDRPYPRTLSFSGYQWRVKKATYPYSLGPDQNYFSDSTSSVWVDNDGLHLRTRQVSGTWYSTELILQQSLGYGTYIFHTNSSIDSIDANAVLGFFSWDSNNVNPTLTHREFDIEFSKWGVPTSSTNSQFITQDGSHECNATNCLRFQTTVPTSNKHMTFYIVWSQGKLDFRAYKGQYWSTPPNRSLVKKWIYTGSFVPTPRTEKIRINLWFFQGQPPLAGQENDVVVENFLYKPPCSPILK